MSNDQCTSYEFKRVRIEIPVGLKVTSDPQGFLAISKNQSRTLLIQLNPHEVIWNASQGIVSQPPGMNPMIDTRILHVGQTETPYPGNEILFEHVHEG